jgi:hypothetical protein
MNIDRSFVSQKALSFPLPTELLVVFGVHGGAAMMLDLAARLSLRGPLYLLDCGNRSNMYRVAKTLRTLTNDPVAVLKNIHLSRAFTCYQVAALLQKLSTGRAEIPILILDLLATFMDESVQSAECNLLFEDVLQRLLLLSRVAPVVVSAKPLLSISSPRFGLLEQLKNQAFQVWEEGNLPPPRLSGVQLSLPVDF